MWLSVRLFEATLFTRFDMQFFASVLEATLSTRFEVTLFTRFDVTLFNRFYEVTLITPCTLFFISWLN